MKCGSSDAPWSQAWDRIDDDFDEYLEEIRTFLRSPTVSASDDDMLAGAEQVAALIEGAGGTAEVIPTAGHPAILGRIEGDGPRLLRSDRWDVAEVYLGCKGIVSFALTCSGGEWGGPVGRALHSSEGVPSNATVEGSIRFDDTEVIGAKPGRLRALRWAGISMVFQGAMSAFNPVKRVGEQVVEAIVFHEDVSRKDARSRMERGLFERVGIAPRRAGDYPRCPVLRSGGAGSQDPRCLEEAPAFEELEAGHRAACHVAAAVQTP